MATLDLDRATCEKLLQSGELPLFERLKLHPKAVLLRILARDVVSGALGSVSIPLGPVAPRAR